MTDLQATYDMSERRACRVIGADRSSTRYRSSKADDDVLRARLKALAEERRRFGYRRFPAPARRPKRVQRLYREEKLTCVVWADAGARSAPVHRSTLPAA